MIKTDRLLAVELTPVEFFKYLSTRDTTQAERAYIDSVMIPGVLGEKWRYYTFWLGIDQSRKEIVCEFYFKGEPDKNGEIEIGYQVVPGFGSMGYTAEMVGLMVDIARKDKEVRRLVAMVREDNMYSQSILRKHGFIKRTSIIWDKKV